MSDPIDAFQDKIRAERKQHVAKNIAGAFKPAGPGATGYSLRADRAPVTALPEIVRAVAAEVKQDWPEYRPDAAAQDGCVAVQFDIAEGDEDLPGIFAYMKTLWRRNQVALRYRLRADMDRWGLRVDSTNKLMFVLMPPWLR